MGVHLPFTKTVLICLPILQKLKEDGRLAGWLVKSLNPSLEAAVLFLDTCGAAPESGDSANMVVNVQENDMVVMLLQALQNVSCMHCCLEVHFGLPSVD